MAITFIGAGAAAFANNADVTPALHVNTAQNDLIVVAIFLRGENVTAASMAIVAVGSGYTQLYSFEHSTGSPRPRMAVFWKIAGAGEANPLVNITPLATGASVGAVCLTFRGTHLTTPIDISGAASENASAQNVGPVSGITPLASDGAVIVIGGKCDDWTSVATLSGDGLTWVEDVDAFTILGQDEGIVVDHAIWVGSPPTVASKTFTVTGGAANKGLGVMFSLQQPAAAPTRLAQVSWAEVQVGALNFPVIEGTAITENGLASTHAINLPSGIVAGETLLAFVRTNGTSTPQTWPAGWVELFTDASDGSNDVTALRYRKADGTEGATFTVTLTGSTQLVGLTWRISGAEDPTVIPPEFATIAVGTDLFPDPGTLTPSAGAKNYLWLAMMGVDRPQTSPPVAFPSGFDLSQIAAARDTELSGASVRIAAAGKNENTASQNPGPFTVDEPALAGWTATTVAVHPGVAAEEEVPSFVMWIQDD